MDLSYTEEQKLLRSSAMDLLEKELPRKRVREIDESTDGFPRDLWQKMAGLGWAGLTIPEEYDGSGRSFTDAAVLHEALGYYAYNGPLLDSGVLSAQVILEAGSAAQKKKYLPAIASGNQVFTFAFTEPDYGWGPNSVKLQATKKGNNYVLNGTKLFIPWANIADQIIVAARTGGSGENGITLFVVEKGAKGVSTRLLQGWLGNKLNEVTFKDVEVPAANVLGKEGAAWPAIENAQDRATAVLNAYMAGGAKKVYEMARDYSTQRIAFGVPIGTFQWVQTHVINSLDGADSAWLVAYEALWRLEEGQSKESVQEGISSAKAVCSESFSRACDSSHDVHAGIGIDLDFGLVYYTVRARTYQQYLGDAIYHKRRIAKLLKFQGEPAAAGAKK